MRLLSGSTLRKIQGGLSQVLNQGFHQPCCLCGRSGPREFCADCWRQVLDCQVNSPLPTTARCPPLLTWGRYQGSLRRAISQMKYQNRPQIAIRLGKELGLRWLQQYPKHRSFVVIPIPLHRDRLSERGYNQAELIAQGFSQVVGVPHLPHGLKRIHQTQAQHSLDPMHRSRNLTGAFAANIHDIKQVHALVMDDIFTTGATILEAIQVLEQRDIPVLGSAVVAQAIYEEDNIVR